MSAPDAAEIERRRKQLVTMLGDYSEARWSAGWMRDVDRYAYAEGGVWEILGREVGWPIGYETGEWLSWDDAGLRYGLGPAFVPAKNESALDGLWLVKRASEMEATLALALKKLSWYAGEATGAVANYDLEWANAQIAALAEGRKGQ